MLSYPFVNYKQVNKFMLMINEPKVNTFMSQNILLYRRKSNILLASLAYQNHSHKPLYSFHSDK